MDHDPLEGFVAGDMSTSNYDKIDLHRHIMDKVVLTSPTGKVMHRESDLIDVWFDSGSMPYAQWHYPFENKDKVDQEGAYPANFIAEGVDQTRGWFFTLHAISSMVFNKVAYKNVISNGLVLDKNGMKMSKRLGNAVNPFDTMEKYGADALRWYMLTNASPWDNLRFDMGVWKRFVVNSLEPYTILTPSLHCMPMWMVFNLKLYLISERRKWINGFFPSQYLDSPSSQWYGSI